MNQSQKDSKQSLKEKWVEYKPIIFAVIVIIACFIVSVVVSNITKHEEENRLRKLIREEMRATLREK